MSSRKVDNIMNENVMDKKKVIKFIVIVYLLSWIPSAIAGIYRRTCDDPMRGLAVFNGTLSLMMFTPMIATLIVNHGLKGMGWKPKFKGNVKWILFCIIAPMVMTILGFVCFFAIFPDLFALDGSYMMKYYELMGMDSSAVTALLDEKGMSMTTVVIITILQAMLEAPFINMFISAGEEAGWRGFLYPELTKGFGKVKGWIIGGLIWSGFHYPAIAIGGHDYGFNYYGAPVLGIVVFTITCTALGILHEIIYDKTKCIWYPSLLHGAINAAFTMYYMVLNGEHYDKIEKLTVFGPGNLALISGIPLILTAIIMGIMVIKKDGTKE